MPKDFRERKASPDNVPDVTLRGAASSEQLGWSVSDAGDVNKDGYPDVIVGAWGVNANVGAAYVYFGGPAMDAAADWTIPGQSAGENLGWSVSAAGDIDGDGHGDVIVGAPSYGATDFGRVYAFFGGAAPDVSPDLVMTGSADNATFGRALHGVGHFDSDGHPEMVIGQNGSGASVDAAYVYGRTDPLPAASSRLLIAMAVVLMGAAALALRNFATQRAQQA